MDGDGEDRPEELKNFFLASEKQGVDVITGIRVKRSEGLLFKYLYFIHKCITKFITGKDIRFGNFTCLSKQAVTTLISDGSVWLSFSGAITKHFSSHDNIDSHRGTRYFGPSKMSLFKLILHSQRISAVFKEIVFVRIVTLILILGLLSYYVSAYFLILYSFFRIISEQFRLPDGHLGYVLGNLSMGSVLSIIILLIGILILRDVKNSR